jgi:hypothetical protein
MLEDAGRLGLPTARHLADGSAGRRRLMLRGVSRYAVKESRIGVVGRHREPQCTRCTPFAPTARRPEQRRTRRRRDASRALARRYYGSTPQGSRRPSSDGTRPGWTAPATRAPPTIPSHEVAGVVEAVGHGVVHVSIGDAVYGLIEFDH